jgi:hypothetical protein
VSRQRFGMRPSLPLWKPVEQSEWLADKKTEHREPCPSLKLQKKRCREPHSKTLPRWPGVRQKTSPLYNAALAPDDACVL